MTASERIRLAREQREYADQRAHDVAWMTATERNEMETEAAERRAKLASALRKSCEVSFPGHSVKVDQ